MAKYAYHNEPTNQSTVHDENCGHCNGGHGRESGPGPTTENGHWSGPYQNAEEARATAAGTGRSVRDCGHCS